MNGFSVNAAPIDGSSAPPRPGSIRIAVFTALRAEPGVSAVVGAKVYPFVLGQRRAPPALVYQLVDDVGRNTLSGPVGSARARFAVTAVSTSVGDCEALAKAVKARFHGFVGDLAVPGRRPVRVREAFVRPSRDFVDAPVGATGRPVYRTVTDVILRYRDPDFVPAT